MHCPNNQNSEILSFFIHSQYIEYVTFSGIREEEPGSSTVLYRSMRLVLMASLTIHFAACLWFGLACSRYDNSIFSLKFCVEGSWITDLSQRKHLFCYLETSCHVFFANC